MLSWLFSPHIQQDVSGIIFLLKTNHWIYESNLYFSKSCHLSEFTVEWFGGLFDLATIHVEIFTPFKQVLSLGFLCTTPAVGNVFVYFFCFEMKSRPLLDLLSTGFTIIENDLFSVGKHRKGKLLHRFKSLTKWRCLQVNAFLSCRRDSYCYC